VGRYPENERLGASCHIGLTEAKTYSYSCQAKFGGELAALGEQLRCYRLHAGFTAGEVARKLRRGQQIKGYEPRKLFKDNPLELPSIVDTTLSDTDIVRTMHPQSITAIFASLENSKKSIRTLNQKEISERELQNLVGISTIHLTSLTKFVEYEIGYQLGNLSQEELFDLHRALIKYFENNPVNSLIKIK